MSDEVITHLTPAELALRWRKHVGTLANWRSHGIGPEFEKLGHRTVLYPIESVQNYEASHRIRPVGKHRPHK